MTAEREGLAAEIAGVLADSIGSELYASLMEATADQWRRWEFMTDAAKEKYRAEGARIVAEAVTPALADLLAARDRRVRAEALREAADTLDSRRSTKGIASRALDPGVAMSVAFLRDEAER